MIVFRTRGEPGEASADGWRRHLLARLPEWIAAGFLFALGAQLSRPGNSFALSHIYDILGRMASERAWAFAALSIATLRLVALILNGFFPVIRRVTPVVRSLSAFASGCVWLALTIGFVMYNTNVLGIVAHAGWGFLDFTYAVLIAHEAAGILAAGPPAAGSARSDNRAPARDA